jgi:hypothetical protein
MALEANLWQRVRSGGLILRHKRHGVHLERIENSAGVGRPDVNGCIDGTIFDLELKAEHRPARASTAIRPKVRPSQAVWMHERIAAGCKRCFVLLQVGEMSNARVYLIPGNLYEDIIAPEDALAGMSVLENPKLPMDDVLLRARDGF